MALREYHPRALALASLLPWDVLVTPSVIQCKDNSLLATLRFRGPDLQSSLASSLVTQAAKLNNLFKRFRGGWALWSEARRREVREYPESAWPDPLSAAVDAESSAFFTQPHQHYVTDTFLSLGYQLPARASQWWQRLLYRDLPTGSTTREAHLAYFQDEVARTLSLLKECCPEATLLTGTDALTYWHSTVNPQWHPVRVPSVAAHMDTYLGRAQDLSGELYPQLGPYFLRCVSFFDYPEVGHPGVTEMLQTLPVEYRACIRYVPLDRAAASTEIGKYRHSHHGQRQDMRSQMQAHLGRASETLTAYAADDYQQEAAHFQSEVDHGRVSAGHLVSTIVVWDTTLEGSREKGELVCEALNTAGFVAMLEDAHPVFKFNTLDAWIGTIPGNRTANARTPLMSSMNLAHLVPATCYWRGPQRTPHLDGPCLLRGVSKGQTPVNVSLHVGDVGHTGLIGSTGDGKSTFLNRASLGFRRYAGGQARVRIFDKGYAAAALTHMVGGMRHDLGTMPLQPFAYLERPGELAWLVDWLDGVLTAERLKVTPAMKNECYAALMEMAGWDRVKRTMSGLVSLLSRRQLKEALGLYTRQGPYGQIFDGEGVELTGHPWQCFEMRTILESPTLLNAQLPVLSHQLEGLMTGLPELWVYHEGWTAFDTPYWATRLRGALKGFRVRNAAVVIATQSLADAVDSPIMPALLDNITTWIFTPNDKALEEKIGEYYQAVGLNLRQRELLTLGTKKRDYYLVQRDGQTMLDLKLGPLALAACRTPEEEEWEPMLRQMTDDPQGFTSWYLGREL